MKKICIALSVFIFMLIKSADAQKNGYVIGLNNDTVHCYVELNRWLAPQYKSPLDEKFHKIKTKYLNGYHIAGDRYYYTVKSVGKKQKKQFVAYIERGKIDFYYANVPYSKERYMAYNAYWYVAKGEDPLQLILMQEDWLFPKKGRKILYYMLNDNQALASEFNNDKKFDFYSVRSYIQRYNLAAVKQ